MTTTTVALCNFVSRPRPRWRSAQLSNTHTSGAYVVSFMVHDTMTSWLMMETIALHVNPVDDFDYRQFVDYPLRPHVLYRYDSSR